MGHVCVDGKRTSLCGLLVLIGFAWVGSIYYVDPLCNYRKNLKKKANTESLGFWTDCKATPLCELRKNKVSHR